MNINWLSTKFWAEIFGVFVSLCAGIIAGITGNPSERFGKIAVAVAVAGLFVAIIRSRLDVLKELMEFKGTLGRAENSILEQKAVLEQTKKSIELYTKITKVIGTIDLPHLQQRAQRKLDEAYGNIEELAKGKIVLGAYESMLYQAKMVRSAKQSIFAIHIVKDKRDLSKWLKTEGEFSTLMRAYLDVKQQLKEGAMQRIFVVASELTEDEKLMTSLRDVKKMSEDVFGFKSIITISTMNILESQRIPALLQVDNTGLVVVQIESTRDEARDYRVIAYEGRGLETMLTSSEFSNWTALQRAPDMSSICFPKLVVSSSSL